ncbi:MAG: hypothetical protein NT166_16050 [Candidatus Aminicenantes bacterium]|nr:hypothetical protein [Candidatus Aminicenantes bacterium]
MSKTSFFEERLMKILVALKNCLKDPVIALLAIRGFSAERIEGIIAIHTDVVLLTGVQQDAYNVQFKTTEELTKLLEGVRYNYRKFRKLGQVALAGEPTTLKALQLDIRMKTGLPGFMAQVKRFYVPGAHDENLSAALLKTGLTREEMEAELPKLEQMEQLNIRQEYEKKVAQDATRRRDERMEELEKAMSELHKVAIVALADQPDFLGLLDLN